jgi:hypothetical protein
VSTLLFSYRILLTSRSIIAVHGLAGTRATSWSVKEEDGERYHWLREKLPKDIPVARILTFEYNSEWYENPSHVDLEECGEQLLRCIIQDRRHQGELLACPARVSVFLSVTDVSHWTKVHI